jgi:hypothetical protein
LILALFYSANSAPWGRQVDPESAYAMNGLAWAAGYPMMKNDHPGTTTILLVGIIIKLWTFLAGRSDVIEFGLKNYDAIIYAARAAEAVILSGVLLVSGVIVRNATRSWLAAMLFQVAPFVSSEAAFRDNADPGKPDGFLRHPWDGTRAQGCARRKTTDDWSRCDAGADIRTRPVIEIFARAPGCDGAEFAPKSVGVCNGRSGRAVCVLYY